MAGKTDFQATPGSGYGRAGSLSQYREPPAALGNVFFVNSATGTDSTGYGLSPAAPFATLAYALTAASNTLLTATNDDVIYVAPGHAESIGAAAGILCATAGITVIGLGKGDSRPTFTWHTTDATFKVTGAGFTLRNVITKVDVDEVVSMFDIRAAGVTLDGVDFQETTSAQALQWLLTTTASPRLTISNCRHKQMTAAASAQKWIQIVGPCTGCRIVDNEFLLTANASTSSHLISGSTAVTDIVIARNLMLFIGGTITIIVNLVTGSTGIISDNRAGSGTAVATAAAFTGDACFFFNNLWADTVAASGLLAPAVDTDT